MKQSDDGLKSLLGFLQGLTPEEREDVFQVRQRVEDSRIRKKEIRKERLFSFQSHLVAESSARKKKEILNDWLGLGPDGEFSEDELVNGLFLRERVKIEDENVFTFLRKKIQELGKTAAVWKHDLGRKVLWVVQEAHGWEYFTLDSFDDVWSHVFTGASSDAGVGGFFVPGTMLRDLFVFIGVAPSDIDDMDFLLDGEGVWRSH